MTDPDRSARSAPPEIDRRSYHLGMINAFAEVVAAGTKRLALSPPLTPQELDDLRPDAEAIAAKRGVQLFLEEDFLVTDLFPASVTDGKHVLLIFHDPSVQREYLALKARKAELLRSNSYDSDARRDVARAFGLLLSYLPARIDAMLAQRS